MEGPATPPAWRTSSALFPVSHRWQGRRRSLDSGENGSEMWAHNRGVLDRKNISIGVLCLLFQVKLEVFNFLKIKKNKLLFVVRVSV